MHNRLKGVTISCLKSTEYMHIRSALVFLSKVGQNFPSKMMAGKAILARVEQIEKDEKERGDLQLMAKSLLAILRRRMTAWFDDEPKDKKNPISSQASAVIAPSRTAPNKIDENPRKRPLDMALESAASSVSNVKNIGPNATYSNSSQSKGPSAPPPGGSTGASTGGQQKTAAPPSSASSSASTGKKPAISSQSDGKPLATQGSSQSGRERDTVPIASQQSTDANTNKSSSVPPKPNVGKSGDGGGPVKEASSSSVRSKRGRDSDVAPPIPGNVSTHDQRSARQNAPNSSKNGLNRLVLH